MFELQPTLTGNLLKLRLLRLEDYSALYQAASDHAYKYVDHVLFFIGPNNLRSRKAVEKLGAAYVDTRSRFGGESVVYRLSKSDYAV